MPQNLQEQALDLKTLFPFELDRFQLEAIAALDIGRSVVVCAPTGAGKTVIGEYAIYRALARGGRVFYTTPLKALSNQKLRDFRNLFGAEQVGLLTGDVSVNRDAPILVMTTEIFRNMLYGTRIGEVGTSLVGVETVVLDECHYMNDRQRGTVWEESIIYCPYEIQLVALSATVANSRQLTDWLSLVHGPTELIYSDFRPVPLQFHFYTPKGLFPLLDDSGRKMNPRLKTKGGKIGRLESPKITDVLSELQKRDMLPAIYFIFSRRGCDKAVADCQELNLVSVSEAQELKQRIDEFLQRNPEAVRAHQLDALYRGIAAHHAGVLPAWKSFIEELFQDGLIKLVFATETLAAGINMPARTTVISSLSKRTDDGHRLLKASEFLQMAGRAGRRGKDVLGHVVTIQTPFEGAKEASYLATIGPDALVSQFTPSYGMVLNLLQTHSIEEVRELVERSFGQYLANLSLQPQQEKIAKLEEECANLKAQFSGIDFNQIAGYEKLYERLKAEGKLLKTLQEQALHVSASKISNALPYIIPGTVLQLKGKHVRHSQPLPAILVARVPGPGQSPYLVCLGQDNRWYVVTSIDVCGLHPELPRIQDVESLEAPPLDMPLKPGASRHGTEATALVAQQIPTPSFEDAPEVIAQMHRVEAVQAQIEKHSLHQWGDPGYWLKRYHRLINLEEEIAQLKTQLQRQAERHWEEFLDLIAILEHFGGLENLKPTPLGETAAAIRGDNELWLGLALASGELDPLAPHHLAAVCAALVTEASRLDNWTNYDISPEVEKTLNALNKDIRRALFQMQRRYRVALPIWLERNSIALVEQWALGVEWMILCQNTSLDEGDVVRILRRTLDFLSQIPHVPHISDSLKINAYRAAQLIDRFPVNEVID